MCTIARERGLVQPKVYQGISSLLERLLILAIYNAIHRGIEPELIPVCRRFGIQIVCYNPLAGYSHIQIIEISLLGGFFSGKYRPDQEVESGRFASNTWYFHFT
jgi:aflatoxin B1 aldehyde reductase